MWRILHEHYRALAGSALGLLIILWPPPKRFKEEAWRQERLAELESGDEERYFEETRELKAYGPESAGPHRLLGAIVLIMSLSLLFL